MATISGGCLCGKIRYSTEAAPKFMSVCHCRDCQRFTGSAFAAVVALPKAGLAVTGAMKGFVKRGDSGKTIERFFCPDCGTSLMDEAEVVPGLVMIQAGTLDDASWVKPSAQIYCASAQPWLRFDPALSLKSFAKVPG
jgi:hypothetical protein